MSALFRDRNSDQATAAAHEPGSHLISSLGWAESHAVIARIERERALASVLVAAAREALESGPWARVNVDPDWQQIGSLERSWPLRGADLWHLAAAKALQSELPELRLLSFDTRLSAAAHGRGPGSLSRA
jgi:hypothetical protein